MRRWVVMILAATVIAGGWTASGPGGVAVAAKKQAKGARCALAFEARTACPKARSVVPTTSRGYVSRDTALKAFDALVAPLPGVRSPKGGYPFIESASGPIRWVLQNWRDLDGAQQAAVLKALPDLDVPGRAAVSARPSRAARPAVARAAGLPSQFELDQLVVTTRKWLNTRFEPDLTKKITIDVEDPYTDAESGAYASVNGNACRVALSPDTANDESYLREILLHELTHCYQYQLDPSYTKSPAWLDEGGPTWVQEALLWNVLGSKYVSGNLRSYYTSYFKDLTAPLTSHSYTAAPYFSHRAHVYGESEVYSSLTKMFANPKDAYEIFTQGPSAAAAYLETLASSGTRLKPLGKRWVTDGPQIPPVDKARYDPPSISVGAGKVKVSAPAYGRRVHGLDPVKGADFIRITPTTAATAWGLVHHEDGDDRLQDGERVYCVAKQCTCKDGVKIQRLGDDGYLSLYANQKAATVQIASETEKEACKQPSTRMSVSGEFATVFEERGACGSKASEMGKGPINPLFTTGYSKQRPRGLGSVVLQFSGTKPGTYRAEPGVVKNKGDAGVTRFDVDTWGSYAGTITVFNVSSAGASGTVDVVLSNRRPPTAQVRLKGVWSCTPYDTILGGFPKKN